MKLGDDAFWHFSDVPPMRPAGPVSEVVRTKYTRSEFFSP
jgi:hypothetical protein